MARVKAAQYQSRLCCLNVPWCYCCSNNCLANRLSSMGALRFQSPSHCTYLCCFLCESVKAHGQPQSVVLECSLEGFFPFWSQLLLIENI